jgi:hypothetical protein
MRLSQYQIKSGSFLRVKNKDINMKLTKVCITLVALMLSSCATSIPQAENIPNSKQKKVMAVQHWGWIANDAVVQTKLALSKKAFAKSQPLYVTDDVNTDFGRGFRKYMIAALIDEGFTVSTKKEGAIELGYEAQVIRHESAFDPLAFGYKPGMAAGTVTGFWVLRNAIQHWSTTSAGIGSVAAAAGYDVYKSLNPGETGVELLISTSITHQDRYVMLNADAYYIEKGEAWLFEGCKGKTRRYCR